MGAIVRMAIVAALVMTAGCALAGEESRVDEVGWMLQAADPDSREVRIHVGTMFLGDE